MRRFPRLRRAILGALTATVVLGLVVGGVGCALGTPQWRGPRSDHFDGEHFITPGAASMEMNFSDTRRWGDFARWRAERHPGAWAPARDVPPGPPPPREVPRGAMRVTFINHATTLIQLDGVNVLTDPIYSERCSPVEFAGPRRVRPPGIRFEDLPRIDAVVVSHNHYDHLDVATLRRITTTWPEARVLVGLGLGAFLEAQHVPHVTELDWWQSTDVRGVTVHSVPNQHFSNRGLFDAGYSLWTAWVLAGPAGRAYFGGDTGYGPHFKAAAARLGPMRLAVLPIGAYRPEWFMGPIHMSPAQAVDAALELGATLAVPMHYGTFPLGDDGETEPVEALRAALSLKPAPFAVLDFGEGRSVPEVAP